MKLTVATIRKVIDYTLLAPNATSADFQEFFAKARRFNFERVFVPPYMVKEAVKELEGVVIGTTVGFPHGNETVVAKLKSAEISVGSGAREIDFVMNIGKALDGDFAYLEQEFSAMRSLKDMYGTLLNIKVILETSFLSPENIREIVKLAANCGLDYVKTSTGYGPQGATIEDVMLMAEVAAGRIKVKASGGIRTLNQVINFLGAGAARIGTSAGDLILQEAAAVLLE
jgi:deoxyribose-phosphate aldolase